MDRMDIYDYKPMGMSAYLSAYGWHFSKKMAEWAVSMMRDRSDKMLAVKEKADLNELIKAQGLKLGDVKGYDDVYAYAMLKSDFFGGMADDELHILKGVVDLINDRDGYDGMLFTRFYADCIGRGIPILWEEML